MCYYFYDKTKFEDLDSDNISQDEKSQKKYFMAFQIKLWLAQNLCVLDPIK